MSKRRPDKTRYWIKPPDGDPHQTEIWRPYGPFTLREIAKLLDWECEVMKEGQSLVKMKDSQDWLPFSTVCPKNPTEIFTDEDFFWKNWWSTRAGKKFIPKSDASKPRLGIPPTNVQPSPSPTIQPSTFQPSIPEIKVPVRTNAPSPLLVASAVGIWQRQQMLSALRELNHTSHDLHHNLSSLNDNLSGTDFDFGGLT